MKPKSKIIVALIAVLLCTFMAVFMSACDDKGDNSNGNDGGNNTHTHTYSAEWSYDDNYHWHVATCEHSSEIDAKATHTLIDGKCSICDYESKTEQPTTQKKVYDMSGVVFADLTVTYDGHEHSIIATNLPAGVIVAYEGNPQINAGTYTITAHFIGDSENYEPIPDKTATLTITKATYDMSGVVFNDLTVAYDGQAYSITATNLPEGVTATYEGNGQTEVGIHTVTAHFAGDSVNYQPIPDKTAKLTIITITLTGIRFEGKTFMYDGQPKSIYISGNLPEDITVEYEGNAQTNAGVHTVTVKFIAPAKYGTLPDLTATLTITKATYDMSGVVFNDLTVTYDGQAHSITATNLPEGVTATYEGNGKTEVGIHTVTAHFAGDSVNYQPIPDKTAKLTIVAISLTGIRFESKSFVYDGQPKSIYISGNLPEDVTVTYIGNEKTEAGVYTVTAKFTAPDYYNQISDLTATLTITRATHKVTFKQAGQPDVVKEVLDLAELNPSDIPKPIEENGYSSIVWEDIDLSCITADITVNAIKTPITYSITYYLDGGTNNADNPTNYNIETATITLLSATKTDYIFAGWYSDEQLKTQVTQIARGSYGNIDLYAKFVTPTAGLRYSRYGNEYTVTDYSGTDKDVVIPNIWQGYPVTSIGSYAFYGCTSLTSITIPDSVTAIGDSAFYGCTSLKSITIPDSVTSIGDSAFRHCTSLTSITIGNGVTSIGDYAFYYCTSLTSITIPDSVTSIGNYAFRDCTSLTSITIPDSVTSIGYGAFWDCTSLESITFGENSQFTSIDSYAFRDCTSLTSITIPNSVKSIGSEAFRDCTSLTSITIPNSVKSIGSYAFYGCTSLTSITFGENSQLTSIDSSAFKDCTSLTSITIPNSVKSIGSEAFYGCTSLTSITIPDGVTSIGYGAFWDCTSLTSITIPDSVTSIGDSAFYNTPYYNTVNNVLYIGNHLIKAKANLSGSYIIKSGTLTIAGGAFAYCTNLSSITIPDSVTSIGSSAFRGCSKLTSITIPDSVTSIGSHAFGNCTILTSITIPDSVTSIDSYAFVYCTSLTSITIGNSVKSIGSYAFDGCTSLESVTIGNGVTSIGESAFEDCTSLVSITIPDSVTSIGWDAFYNCTSLESITFGENSQLTSIGSYAFKDCTRLVSITIPDSVTYIGSFAFRDCTSLTSITIPNSVKSIGSYAFDGCTRLKTVYYGGTAEQWDEISIGSNNTSLTNATRYYNSSGSGNAGSNTYKTQWESNSLLKLLPFPTFGTCTGITTMTGNAGATFTGATEANFKAYISLISGTFSTNSSLTGNNSYVAYNAAGTIRVAIGYANGNFTVLVTQV